MMRQIKTHTFNHHRYVVAMWPVKGLTDVCRSSPLTLALNTKEPEKRLLATTIHEALHACDWNMSEKKVDRISKDIGSFLWRLGYRQTHGKKT